MRTSDRSNRRQLRLCAVSTGESEKREREREWVRSPVFIWMDSGPTHERMDEKCRGETPRDPEEGALEHNSPDVKQECSE